MVTVHSLYTNKETWETKTTLLLKETFVSYLLSRLLVNCKLDLCKPT